jgi:hypothetical protein
MDEFLEFVEFNLLYTNSRKLTLKEKRELGVRVPFRLK